DVLLAGVVPTPAVAYLVRQNKNAAGIVISASHNPWYDNGIKVFGPEGRKLSEAVESEIETLLARSAAQTDPTGKRHMGWVRPLTESLDAYIDFLCESVPAGLLNGMSVVLDCAHGAASAVASPVFEKLGAALIVLNAAPDGRNINAECGSEHPDGLIQAVKNVNANIGLAFDGDADRLIAVDENGHVVAGDQLIAICASHYKEKHLLENNCVVTTVMSNIGLQRTLEKLDITHAVSGVGDRYVMEKM
ncbi:MAG: phosphoglucosamine mutase, partial [Sulfitobacter sp.]|nr:phosphoglucosamine mutase [Sulfitobacter sp.]